MAKDKELHIRNESLLHVAISWRRGGDDRPGRAEQGQVLLPERCRHWWWEFLRPLPVAHASQPSGTGNGYFSGDSSARFAIAKARLATGTPA